MMETPFPEKQMLAELEKLGLRAHVIHLREIKDGGHSTVLLANRHNNTIMSRGGMTIVVLKDERGRNFSQGVAHVSQKDNYCKATGRRIALHRALYGMVPWALETDTAQAARMYE